MYAKIFSGSLFGLEGEIIKVETDIAPGMPVFNVVGLPDTAVKEARERIRAALINSGCRFPMRRITVNLSPADTRKEGTYFDLPIALGLLAAEGDLILASSMMEGCAFIGELSLEGELVSVRGALPLAIALREKGIRRLVLPKDNLEEVQILEDMKFYPISDLKEIVAVLEDRKSVIPWVTGAKNHIGRTCAVSVPELDFSQVRGQERAKRALQISAAGGHSLLLIGPPGAGKTMLARRLPGILPPMNYEEILEVTKIYSAAGELPGNRGVIAQRPFRAPHHTISAAALAGGGAKPKPGEISLAHGGVLFLDEIPEFGRRSLEVLRQPLEEKQITISRTSGTAAFPSDFLLIAACNPCPCGFYGDGTERCQCSAGQIHSYMAKLSGPLMDRIDMHIELSRIGWEELNPACETEDMSLDSKTLREAVCAARALQKRRYRDTGISCNAQLQQNAVNRYCQITAEAGTLMRNAFARLPLSARSCKKILLLARTIADLEGSEKIQAEQIAEAIQYRNLDRIRF